MAPGVLTVSQRRKKALPIALFLLLAACSSGTGGGDSSTAAKPSAPSAASASPSEPTEGFPTAMFASLVEKPVSNELAAELQEVLETSANGDGATATVMTPEGTWSGATGFASGDRAMVPDDQMSIASITKTPVAAQVMQLVEEGRLSLDDLAADRLPPDLKFDTNGATIENLLSMRSGISEYGGNEQELRRNTMTDPLRRWTLKEKLATVSPERGPVGGEWEYIGTNYLLLGLIIEEATGRSVGDVLRDGVLKGNGYERLIYQPDERPTKPMAMPSGASADTFDSGGGYLPSIANVTMFTSEGAMASDAPTLARWFRALCAGQVVSPATLDEMADFDKRPEYGLGLWDRRIEYGSDSGALGHTGLHREGYRSAALCFQDPGTVVVILANQEDHDVDTTAGDLWRAAVTG